MGNKKIQLIVSSSCGGAERMTLIYAKILKETGFECRLLVYQNRKKEFLLKPFLPADIAYDLICCSDKMQFYYFVKYINAYSPDIVFCSQPKNSRRVLLLRSLRLIKCRFVYREFLMPSDQGIKIIQRNKKLINADCIIAQTKEMAEDMTQTYGWDSEKITTIYNPLDKQYIQDCIKENSPLDKTNINFVAMNRVSMQKDIITMLEAFEICKSSIANAQLYILGSTADKEYVSSVERFILSHKLSESVHIEGLQQNPYKYLKEANAFVMSSLYEGLPNAMLEAMYLGIPVAVTRSIPFIETTVQEGITGFTVPTKSPEELASAMLKASRLQIHNRNIDITNSERQVVEVFARL